ncbi:hypothetical protein H072_7560 [Dactylellina haptotyla CBS 200.50]|uniref:Uncharacterized protein n=1 Tax=Dactylellina haptotyla (strain CBS 200.50) TaxID=1284197 RepID=S8AC79_DACHA|nr:hypothetical protein H072_7560 [Dactylellina haptotyla CBS 200.50]
MDNRNTNETVTTITTSNSDIPYTLTRTTIGGTVTQTSATIVTSYSNTTTIIMGVGFPPEPTARMLKERTSARRRFLSIDICILIDLGLLSVELGIGYCGPTIPSYAKSCPDPSAYASACSCIGAPAGTATASAITTTITRTVTATSLKSSSKAVTTQIVTIPIGTVTAVVKSTTVGVATATYSLFDLRVTDAPNQNGNLFVAKSPFWAVKGFSDYGLLVQPDARVYYPYYSWRYYMFCTQSDLTGDAQNNLPVIKGGRYGIDTDIAVAGQEVLCSLDAGQYISCNCTAFGSTWTNIIYGPNGYVQLAPEDYVYRSGFQEAKLKAQAIPYNWDQDCQDYPVCGGYWDLEHTKEICPPDLDKCGA